MRPGSPWRWRGTVAMTGIALGLVVYPLIEGKNDVINSDWPAFATGARLIVEDPGHLYNFDVQRRTQLEVTGGRSLVSLGINGILPFLAPAWVAFFAVPFEALGTDVGGRLWILFGLACLALGLLLAVRPRPPDAILPPLASVSPAFASVSPAFASVLPAFGSVSPAFASVVPAFASVVPAFASVLPAFASVPTALLLLNAQLDGLVALGIGGALALWGSPWLAGFALGLTLVKPQLVLPLGAALLLARQWRVLAGWAMAGIVLFAAAAALNPRWLLDWLPALLSTVQPGAREVNLAHLGTVLPHALQGYGVVILSLLGLIAVLALARRRGTDFRAAAAVLVIGGVLAAPHALPTDLVMAAVGLVIWGEATWADWLVLSVGAMIAAVVPAPLPTLVGVLLVGWLCLRVVGGASSGWRRAQEPASAR